MRLLTGTAHVSAATLLLQVTLTRVFSIAQFYHFAFLVISLALLGFGASGSLLAIWPRLGRRGAVPWHAVGFTVSLILAYLFVNHLPFDSYTIATDPDQVVLLIVNLLALAVPFMFAGAVIGALLSAEAENAGRIYGANLLGSAAGAVLGPLAINLIGSERSLLLGAALACGAAVLLAERRGAVRVVGWGGAVAAILLLAILPPVFAIQPSPYKTLSAFRLNPNATITSTRESAASRLDIIESATIHSAPGLSLGYMGELPPQMGLLVDGDNLLAVADTRRAPAPLAAAMPAAVAYAVRPQADVLLLGSGGNMEAWVALANGAPAVTVVEPDRLVFEALTGDLLPWEGLQYEPRLAVMYEEIRSYAQRGEGAHDVVLLTLTDNYRPITSGAFSLSENYTLTVEAFQSYLRLAGDDGLFVMTRWLQSPPSESLRVLGIILEALDSDDPLAQIVVFRSFQTATFIVRPTPFTPAETESLLAQISAHQYDLVLAPVMPADLINQHARLETPLYHDTFLALVNAPDRAAFWREYAFDVSPPTDERPFFYHFFRWEQTPDLLENLGRRWQPFGGSGIFMLVALLIFALAATAVFVLLPVGLRRRFRHAIARAGWRTAGRTLLYFAALGLAYLVVEITLIQRYILVLGQPTVALATVVAALLAASGVGSALSARVAWRPAMLLLALLLIVYPVLAHALAPFLLALPLLLRYAAVVLLIAPVGFLMGIPFARGIAALAGTPELVSWAWAVNGSASVISGVLAVMLALAWGFTWVMVLGGLLYLLAALLAVRVTPARTGAA
ncbi:MAG: hypothetical protein JW910_06725 [Anaerolineae bacterium]|nr:hypothetical protein [Anaerolineae bacterium]